MENVERSHLQASRCEVSSIVGCIVLWFGNFTFFLPLVMFRGPFLGEVSWSAYELMSRNASNEEPSSRSLAIAHEQQSKPTDSLASPNRRVPRRTSSGITDRHLAMRVGE